MMARGVRSVVVLFVVGAAVLLAASPASSQTRSPCAPGGPANRPANPNNPSQYPPNECGLRLGKTAARPGEPLTVSGDGYRPNSPVEIEMRSAPTTLGSTTASSAGSFSATVTIPSNATPGRHTIAALGRNLDGSVRELTAEITITGSPEAARSGTLPRTGTSDVAPMAIAGVTLTLLGGAAVVAARQRRRHAA